MEPMDAGPQTRPTLQALFEAAKSFGLTDAEAWELFDCCLDDAGEHATVSEYMDDLAATLARCILAKERRILSRTDGGRIAQGLGRRPAA
jgi:hypothetical protein